MAETTIQLPPFDFGKLVQVLELIAQYQVAHPGAIQDEITLVTKIIALFTSAPAA
jgi:hypothetical protein